MNHSPVTNQQFRAAAFVAIQDVRLQGALEGATAKFSQARQQAWAEMPAVPQLRAHLKQIRANTLAQLADHLEQFERQATAAGAQVHWARDGAEASQIVLGIARQRGVSLVAKSKSMVTEEIGLNQALEGAGIRPVETDLGEYIIQLANEPPSHIIAPAIHKTRGQVAELLSREAGKSLPAGDIPLLTAEARLLLREKFLAAGIGLSGVNLGVAESGSIVLVTNEGNGRMVTSLPPVHIAIMGLEKVTPTWGAAAVWLSLLARSATGQPLSIYTTIITGPARPGDPDGPQEVHIILLDNGRGRLLGTPYEEALQCIRCGACLNVCPVYREVGGHAYGSPYSGPIGAVISPLLFGLEKFPALPQASSLCGACLEACPVQIDLPRLLLELRQEAGSQAFLPWLERKGEELAAFALSHERVWQLTTAFLRLGQRLVMNEGQLPGWLAPAGARQLPPLAPQSFSQLWQNGEV